MNSLGQVVFSTERGVFFFDDTLGIQRIYQENTSEDENFLYGEPRGRVDVNDDGDVLFLALTEHLVPFGEVAPSILTTNILGICPADLAPPAGRLTDADTMASVQAFLASEPEADLFEPAGVINFADAQEFGRLIRTGCELLPARGPAQLLSRDIGGQSAEDRPKGRPSSTLSFEERENQGG